MNNSEIEKVLKIGGYCRAQSLACGLLSSLMMLPFFLLIFNTNPSESILNLISSEPIEFGLFVFGAFGSTVGAFGLEKTRFLARENADDSFFKLVLSPVLDLLYMIKKVPEWVLFTNSVSVSEADELRIKSKIEGSNGFVVNSTINLVSIAVGLFLAYWVDAKGSGILLNGYFVDITWPVLVGVFALPLLVLSVLVLIISHEIIEIVGVKNG